MFYDHFLARDWSCYHVLSLGEYVQYIHATLAGRLNDFPDRSRLVFDYMVENNILAAYASIEGISMVLEKMAGRARFNSKMERAGQELVRGHTEYERDFKVFLPQLQTYSRATLDALNPSTQLRR